MTKIDKGSIILFGSTAGKIRDDAFFQLDTVFVVADWIEYDPANLDSLRLLPHKWGTPKIIGWVGGVAS